MKIHNVRAELFHLGRWTDRQTDMTKLVNNFRSFAKVSKNSAFCPQRICVFNIFLATKSCWYANQ